MGYCREIPLNIETCKVSLYLTDDACEARRLKDAGEAVLVHFHEGNKGQDFSGFAYAVLEPEEVGEDYFEKVYRRLKGLPIQICETERCLVREMVPEDGQAFYDMYRSEAVSRFLQDIHESPEAEAEYIRSYSALQYAFYDYGIWSIVEKESGQVIGRAGFTSRSGYETPELGYLIGEPWQGKGYAYEVCSALLEYGQKELEFDRVQTLIAPENEASLNLAMKLGFEYREEIALSGKPMDLFLRETAKY